MNKKIYSLFSILFLLLSTGCTLQNPAENSGVKVAVLKDSFYVVFDRNFKLGLVGF
jgi:hypothetical protein